MKKIAMSMMLIMLPASAAAKNVILFIGDGMGSATVTATRFYKYPKGDGKLFMDTIPLAAHVMTKSHDNIVTDSAAASTAMATGTKAENNCIGFGPVCSEKNLLKTISDHAAEAGISVGLVTTTRITHATPAAFYAHVTDREREDDIARQLQESEIDVAMGGGLKYFKDIPSSNGGHAVVTDMDELKGIGPDTSVIGCFSDGHIPLVTERNKEGYKGPTLVEMTKAAIERLSKNPKGYFLMVEGGRIDHAAHQNRAAEMFEEVLEFDKSIEAAAKVTSPDETQILVTADHESGGPNINGYPKLGSSILGDGGIDADGRPYPALSWSTGPKSLHSRTKDPFDGSIEATHTGADVPLYAIAPVNERLQSAIENTYISNIILKELFDH